MRCADWRDDLMRFKLAASSTLPACMMGKNDRNLGVFADIERAITMKQDPTSSENFSSEAALFMDGPWRCGGGSGSGHLRNAENVGSMRPHWLP